ncbi:M4 family metallopeptidase [Paractinoplanes durhamensis]|uniref:Neutral metalloproteinase n=1 Tax=Paractinoplanes durhamensis TaxID=113563 RepID=A0ABQ3Z3H3_9ACTN|nr:M4 family metallopeptidase [Actinoplanes durhamensis]GIE04094.1 metalloprotease [Actinoplanes durhamensis]
MTYRINCITPPYLLNRLLDSDNDVVREAALNTLLTTAHLRGQREVRGLIAGALGAAASGRRSVFDCEHGTFLPRAELVRSEDDAPVKDASVNQAFDGLGATRDFYREVFQRDSIDGRGLRLLGYVHRGRRYNNAFWDGQEMVFGDGDGEVFGDFTGSLDVIAHELGHGVTEHTANLEYRNQSGALNESLSDVVGSMVKQWSRKQSAEEADWLIGAEIFTPGVEADALRSMKAPGTAYDNEMFGKDPQPAHMDHYADLPDTDEGDNGGVHINSGIPNKAFYLVATGIGGFSWEAPGHIWYESLRASTSTTDFQGFADTTFRKADELYGAGSAEQQAVRSAWDAVGVRVTTTPTLARGLGRTASPK